MLYGNDDRHSVVQRCLALDPRILSIPHLDTAITGPWPMTPRWLVNVGHKRWGFGLKSERWRGKQETGIMNNPQTIAAYWQVILGIRKGTPILILVAIGHPADYNP